MTWLVPDSMSLAKAMTYGSLAKMEHRCTRSNPSSSLVAPCGLHTAFACILVCYLPQNHRHFTAIHICSKWHLRIFLLADIAARHGTRSPADPSLLCKMSETGIEHMPLIDSIVYPENHCRGMPSKGCDSYFCSITVAGFHMDRVSYAGIAQPSPLSPELFWRKHIAKCVKERTLYT